MTLQTVQISPPAAAGQLHYSRRTWVKNIGRSATRLPASKAQYISEIESFMQAAGRSQHVASPAFDYPGCGMSDWPDSI